MVLLPVFEAKPLPSPVRGRGTENCQQKVVCISNSDVFHTHKLPRRVQQTQAVLSTHGRFRPDTLRNGSGFHNYDLRFELVITTSWARTDLLHLPTNQDHRSPAHQPLAVRVELGAHILPVYVLQTFEVVIGKQPAPDVRWLILVCCTLNTWMQSVYS
eukprot:TRINITY_DN68056_c0_g1_i1.p3 TRINITY_DN68056_c0_g1~~TRINITY_DN68056_c0_g1_i1.p3  ORF type:complete len:158 (-),score=3.23 TRINITY_DN68056_c0_g1_i1:562-1035(-)